MLIVAVMAAWVVVVLATFPRGHAATGPETNRSAPDERRPHYEFPTYA